MLKLIVLISLAYLSYSLSYNGIIKVGEEGSRKNPAFFPISATCTIHSGASTVQFKVTSGWIKINGKKYNSGSQGTIITSPGQIIEGQVGGFAAGWGKNIGPDAINYTCSGDLGLMRFFAEEISETQTIQPGQSSTFRSPLLWSATISCKIACSGTNIVQITNKEGTITINNTPLADDQSMNLTVSNGDTFYAHLSGHAEAEFFDYGSNPVKATCSTNLDENMAKYMTETGALGLMRFFAEEISETQTIQPGQSSTFRSPLLWSATISCKIACSGTNIVQITNKEGTITINNTPLADDQSMNLTVSNGDTFYAHLSGHAEAEFFDYGSNPVKATCSTNLDEYPAEYMIESIEISPAQTKYYHNPLSFEINLKCIAICEGTNEIYAHNIQGSMKLDSKELMQGNSMRMYVINGTEYKITYGEYAEASLQNLGENTVTFDCGIDFLQDFINFHPKPVTQLSRVVSLPAGASKEEASPVFWAVSGTCKVLAPTNNDDQITFKVLSGDAWFGKGSRATTKVQGTMSLNVTAGEEFTVKVGGGASGQLTNDGKFTLTANCTADLAEENKFLE